MKAVRIINTENWLKDKGITTDEITCLLEIANTSNITIEKLIELIIKN